jgi:carboxypeptidase PM20D1
MLNQLGINDISDITNNGELNAMIYDTYAPTMACASDTMNVLRTEAKIGINIRIINENTIQNTLEKIRAVLPDDIEVKVCGRNNPTPVSRTDSPGYKKIYSAMRKLFDQAIVVPGMVSVGTDCRHFHEICENVYRITPFVNYFEDSKTMHKPDEKLSAESFMSAIHFYYGLLEE